MDEIIFIHISDLHFGWHTGSGEPVNIELCQDLQVAIGQIRVNPQGFGLPFST